jgi:hypothetical protein
MTEEQDRIAGDRLAGAALLSAAAVSVLAMAHHPVVVHSGAVGPLVHATMIAVAGLLAFGFAHLSLRRGLGRPAVLAGLVAYVLAMFGHVGAATINGFVVTALAARPESVPGRDVFLLAFAMNQALGKVGVYAGSAAYVFWSLDFLARPGAEPRLIGIAGLLAGLVPAFLLAAGWIRLDVTGASLVYAVQGGWAVLVGLHLIRGQLDADATRSG